MTISQSDGLQNDTGLIAALNLVATGGVTADFHSDGSMKFAGSGRLWPGVWRAHGAGLIAPEGDWERGEQIVLTDAGRAALSQTQASI